MARVTPAASVTLTTSATSAGTSMLAETPFRCRPLSFSAKEILNELEALLGDVTSAIHATHGNLSPLSDLDFEVELNEQATYKDLEEKDALSHSQSSDVTHLAMVMAFIYSMVKQDYLMQEKIVSALDIKMSSEELESYCQMWSLRPFINDEIVHQAWERIH